MAYFSALTSLILLLILSVSSPSVHGNFKPAKQCSSLMENMETCLPFVQVGSLEHTPEGSCCIGLKKIVDTNVSCLCEWLKNSDSMGITLDLTRASTLPPACNLTAPSIASCTLPGTTIPPATAPVPVPDAAPKPGPASAPVPSEDI